MNQAVIEVVYICLMIVAVCYFAVLILTIIYDLRQARFIRSDSVTPKKKQTAITLIIVNRSSYERTMKCIGSIARSDYKNYDIVLLDNATGRPDLSKYRRKSSKDTPFRFYRRRKAADMVTALKEAYKRSRRGALVVVIESIDVLDEGALRRAERFFTNSAQSDVVRMNSMTANAPGITGLLQSLDDVMTRVGYRMKSLVMQERQKVITAGYIFRSSLLSGRKKKNDQRIRSVFLERVGRTVESDSTMKGGLRFRGYKGIGPGILLVVIGYFCISLAIRGETEAMIVYWVSLCVLVLTAVIVDASLSIRHKSDAILLAGLLPFIVIAATIFKRNSHSN